jgi:uncharacterized membrane protein
VFVWGFTAQTDLFFPSPHSAPWYGIVLEMTMDSPSGETVAASAVLWQYTWEGRMNNTCTADSKSDSKKCNFAADSKAGMGKKHANITSWEDLDEPHVFKTFRQSHIISTVGGGLMLVAFLLIFFGMCCHASAKHCHAGAVKASALVLLTGATALVLVGGLLFVNLPNSFAKEDSCKEMTKAFEVTKTPEKTWCTSFMGAETTKFDVLGFDAQLTTMWFPLEGWWMTLGASVLMLCTLFCVAISQHHRHHHHGSYTYTPIQG